MSDIRSVGIPSPRVEGQQKVGGAAVYAVDVALPDMLWVKVLRSPIAHGRIKSIDASKALRLPGVQAALTGADLSGARIGKKIVDMPLLAEDVVRYAGEKVAAVAAESEAIAAEALDLIDVEYEDLPVITDPLAAMAPDAPLLHPQVADYKGLLHKIETPSNVFVRLNWKKGEVEEGFRQSDIVVENTFTVPAVHQAYIEPHCSVVRINADGTAEIWSANKSPFALRDQVGNALQIAPGSLIIRPCYVGGDFGGKGDGNDVALCYALARKTGRPVKMLVDYAEELIAGNPRHGAVIRVKTGVKRNGILIAQHVQFVFDSGAYGAYRPQGFLVGAHDAPGPYRVPNCLVEEKYVYTNKMPCGYMRAPGHLQAMFACESQADLVARRLNMDPAEFRRMNLMHDGDAAPLGEVVPHVKATETLAKALDQSGYRRTKAKNTGRGCAIADWISKGGESYALLTLDEEGTVTLASAVTDTGPGVFTMMRQIVGEELKVSLDAIQVEMLDSSRVVKDTGVRGSSSTRVHGSSALDAARKMRAEILKAAGKLLHAAPEDLILYDGGVTHGRAEQRMTYAEIVQANGAPLTAEGHYMNMADGPEASLVAQVAEVEVDAETGEVRVTKLTTAHNTGTILNPLTHQGQIDGAVIMGMGYGVIENLAYDESGKVLAANLGEYKIPNIQDIPQLNTTILQSDFGSGPYNSMSIGETALIPTAAAIANAVEDAVGVRIKSLPITAEKVLTALKGKADE
ncbi:MAG TPA: xanthine dehydrogenase family protein molybdopterin-binding subunit [Candidatus Binatia bacterium]|nr:xanthine dehydrogenase family protein molybdopterin-binding subunit [Candidatus Binatia bacterium]